MGSNKRQQSSSGSNSQPRSKSDPPARGSHQKHCSQSPDSEAHKTRPISSSASQSNETMVQDSQHKNASHQEQEIMIRRLRREDLDSAISLLLSKLPSGSDAKLKAERARRWRWQFYENPANPEPEPILWVAESVREEITTCAPHKDLTECKEEVRPIIGLVCPLAVRLRTPKGMTMASWCNDWIVDESYRGKGVGWRLEEAWVKTFPVALGRGWSERAYKVSVKLGLVTVGGFFRVWIVLSRAGFAYLLLRSRYYRRLKQLLRLPPKLVCQLKKPIPRNQIQNNRYAIEVTESLPLDAGILWNRVAPAYRFAVERDQQYLTWRYSQNPFQHFQFVGIRSSKGLEGLAIVRLSSDKPPIGVVCDLIADPNDRVLIQEILNNCLSLFREKGACAATIDVPPALFGAIKSLPNPKIAEEIQILVGDNEKAFTELGIYDSASWYLSRSDSDIDFSLSALA